MKITFYVKEYRKETQIQALKSQKNRVLHNNNNNNSLNWYYLI